MDVSVVLAFVSDHDKHLHHGMIDTFGVAIAARVIGSCGEVVYVEQFTYGSCKLSAEFTYVVGRKGGRASSETDIIVY